MGQLTICSRCEANVGTRFMAIDGIYYCLRCALPSLLKWARKYLDQRRGDVVTARADGDPDQGFDADGKGSAMRALSEVQANQKALDRCAAAIETALDLED